MDTFAQNGLDAGTAIAVAARNNPPGSQLNELVVRELNDLTHPAEVLACVATVATILSQHFRAPVTPGRVEEAGTRIPEAIRTAFAEEQTGDQLTNAVLTLVADLNRNELAATLAAFVVAQYYVDPEGGAQ